MSGRGARRGGLFCTFVLLGLGAVLTHCAQPATPTATPRPTPTALEIYVMMTDRYTSFDVIVTIYAMSAEQAGRILHALQAIEAPPDLQELHEQAVSAYEHVYSGKMLLPGADPVLRSEAYFMVDWGISLLIGY